MHLWFVPNMWIIKNSALILTIFLISLDTYSQFDKLVNHIIPIEFTKSTYKDSVEIYLVIVEGDWTKQKVLKRFSKLRSIYGQCKIGVTIGSLKEVKWKYSGNGIYYDLNNSFSNRYFDGTLQLLSDLDIKKRPLGIFIDSFDEYMPKLATSFPEVSLHNKTIALNTFWITNKVNSPKYLDKEPDSYSVFAHELGHLLLNDTHVTGSSANLMHGRLEMLNGDLDSSQCLAIRENLKNQIM